MSTDTGRAAFNSLRIFRNSEVLQKEGLSGGGRRPESARVSGRGGEQAGPDGEEGRGAPELEILNWQRLRRCEYCYISVT